MNDTNTTEETTGLFQSRYRSCLYGQMPTPSTFYLASLSILCKKKRNVLLGVSAKCKFICPKKKWNKITAKITTDTGNSWFVWFKTKLSHTKLPQWKRQFCLVQNIRGNNLRTVLNQRGSVWNIANSWLACMRRKISAKQVVFLSALDRPTEWPAEPCARTLRIRPVGNTLLVDRSRN